MVSGSLEQVRPVSYFQETDPFSSLDEHSDHRAFRPVQEVDWIEEGRRNQRLLPWAMSMAEFNARLQSAVERGYLNQNPAHGIRLRDTRGKAERRYYTPAVIQKLLPELSEPCRTVVTVALLTGLRIGEILAMRWKRAVEAS